MRWPTSCFEAFRGLVEVEDSYALNGRAVYVASEGSSAVASGSGTGTQLPRLLCEAYLRLGSATIGAAAHVHRTHGGTHRSAFKEP